MTLPASGPITLFNLRDEFGDSSPVNLFDYYRGGSLVLPSPDNNTVPTSGTITLFDFYSTRKFSVIMVNRSGLGSGSQGCLVRFHSDGIAEIGPASGPASMPDWAQPKSASIGSLYEIRASLLNGTPPNFGDALNTWLSLSTDRDWIFGGFDATCTLRISIRDALTGTIRDTADYQLTLTGF